MCGCVPHVRDADVQMSECADVRMREALCYALCAMRVKSKVKSQKKETA
jgi:hypothetical protein